MKRGYLLVLSLFMLLHSSYPSARDWYEYRSDNFTLYSDVSRKRADTLLQDLERFRTAALLFTGLPDTPESRRLQAFHFKSSSEFNDFAEKWSVAGFYMETWDGPLIFSQQGKRGETSGNGVMFHEYIHHLMRSRSNMTYPMWYSEGFAELLASAELRDDRISLGVVPEWRRDVFDGRTPRGPMNVQDLLAPEHDNDIGIYWHRFYASAWLFTHYLQLGPLNDKPSYHTQTQQYLLALHRGAEPVEAFEEHYGLSAEEMEMELKRYRRGRIPGASFDSPPYEKPILRRKIAEHERYYLLADKAFEVGNEGLALDYLEDALKAKPDWWPALSFLAVLERHTQNKESLDNATNIVRSLGVKHRDAHQNLDDYRTALNLAHYHMDLHDEIVKSGSLDDGLKERAAKFAEKAISLNPESIEAHRFLWKAQKNPHKPVVALKTMMKAFQLDPSSLYVNKEIGFFLAEAQRLDLAKPFLQRVLAWSHPGRDRTRAKNLLERLKDQQSPAPDRDE